LICNEPWMQYFVILVKFAQSLRTDCVKTLEKDLLNYKIGGKRQKIFTAIIKQYQTIVASIFYQLLL